MIFESLFKDVKWDNSNGGRPRIPFNSLFESLRDRAMAGPGRIRDRAGQDLGRGHGLHRADLVNEKLWEFAGRKNRNASPGREMLSIMMVQCPEK